MIYHFPLTRYSDQFIIIFLRRSYKSDLIYACCVFDKTLCDICGHQNWDEKDEQHNELIEIYLEFDDDYEDCVGFWCKPCKETIEMDVIEMMFSHTDYQDGTAFREAKIIISQEIFDYINKSKKSLLDNVVMRSRGELD